LDWIVQVSSAGPGACAIRTTSYCSIAASGAIFGILGALLAAHLRTGETFPSSVLRPLRNSTLIFVSYALLNGLQTKGIDNVAHLGGLTSVRTHVEFRSDAFVAVQGEDEASLPCESYSATSIRLKHIAMHHIRATAMDIAAH
jgi:hypothetical protein